MCLWRCFQMLLVFGLVDSIDCSGQCGWILSNPQKGRGRRSLPVFAFCLPAWAERHRFSLTLGLGFISLAPLAHWPSDLGYKSYTWKIMRLLSFYKGCDGVSQFLNLFKYIYIYEYMCIHVYMHIYIIGDFIYIFLKNKYISINII